MMLLWIVGTIGMQFFVGWWAPGLASTTWMTWLINDVPLYCVGVPVFLLVLHFVPDGPKAAPRNDVRFGVGKFVLCFLFCLGASYFINLLVSILMLLAQLGASGGQGALPGNAVSEMLMDSEWIYSLIFAVCVPAVGEEFIFRYMIRKKMNGCAERTYILFSALCFAVFHGNIIQAPYAFVIGIVLGWMYVVSGRLWLCMLMHFAINLMGAVLVPLLSESVVGMLVFGLVLILLIITAIVFFFVFKGYVFRTMRPPYEPGWPYKPPKMRMKDWHAMRMGTPLAAYAPWPAVPPHAAAGAGEPETAAGWATPQMPPWPPYGQPPLLSYGQGPVYGYGLPHGYGAAVPMDYGPYPYGAPPPPPGYGVPPEGGRMPGSGGGIAAGPPYPVYQAGVAAAAGTEADLKKTPAQPLLAPASGAEEDAAAPQGPSREAPPEAAEQSTPAPNAQDEPKAAPAAAAPPPIPGYGAPPAGHGMPAPGYPPPYGYGLGKPPGAGGICFGNVGMVLYLVLGGLFMLLNTAATLLMAWLMF